MSEDELNALADKVCIRLNGKYVLQKVCDEREGNVKDHLERGEKKMDRIDNRMWQSMVIAIIQLLGIVTLLVTLITRSKGG